MQIRTTLWLTTLWLTMLWLLPLSVTYGQTAADSSLDLTPKKSPPADAAQAIEAGETGEAIASGETVEKGEVVIFRLNYAEVLSVADLLHQIYKVHDQFKVVADERTNSLVVLGTKDQRQVIGALLTEIDIPPAGPRTAPPSDLTKVYETRDDQLVGADGESASPIATNEDLATLRNAAAAAEHEAAKLAELCRQLRQQSRDETAELAQAQTRLTQVVTESFQLRQRLHRAELSRYAQRLERLRQSVDLRDRLVDTIVRRRVQELLDPNTQWTPADMLPTTYEPVSDASKSTTEVRPKSTATSEAKTYSVEVAMFRIDQEVLAQRVALPPAQGAGYRVLTPDAVVQLHQLVQEGKASLTANPTLIAKEGQPASLRQGGELPIRSLAKVKAATEQALDFLGFGLAIDVTVGEQRSLPAVDLKISESEMRTGLRATSEAAAGGEIAANEISSSQFGSVPPLESAAKVERGITMRVVDAALTKHGVLIGPLSADKTSHYLWLRVDPVEGDLHAVTAEQVLPALPGVPK